LTRPQPSPALGKVLRRAAGAWDEFRFWPEEFFESGETVVVPGHSDVRKGGVSATTPVVRVWRRQDDRIRRFRFVTDTLQLARLLGLA